MAAAFQSFSPTYAQGIGLSSVVKINGLQREVPTNSTAVGTVTGVVGTVINNGIVMDSNGNLWDLPASVTIPLSGTLSLTVTAEVAGNITALIGGINIINTPQLGWQSFINTAAASVGNPVETDAQLKVRQTQSTSIAAVGIKTSLYSNIANLPGVSRLFIYENDTDVTDGNGVAANSFDCIVEGGDVQSIVNAIGLLKPPGIKTDGGTSGTYTDVYGLPSTIHFDELTQVPICFAITIKALPGYVSTTATAAMDALAAFVNGLAIGEDVYASQAAAVASLGGIPGIGQSFYIVHFYLDITAVPVASSNITIAFNAAATADVADMTWTVT
jgi:uncharacterized phage protein gp47/JayE